MHVILSSTTGTYYSTGSLIWVDNTSWDFTENEKPGLPLQRNKLRYIGIIATTIVNKIGESLDCFHLHYWRNGVFYSCVLVPWTRQAASRSAYGVTPLKNKSNTTLGCHYKKKNSTFFKEYTVFNYRVPLNHGVNFESFFKRGAINQVKLFIRSQT